MSREEEIEVLGQAMSQLGSTADEVAAKLEELGVRGEVGSFGACPLAIHFRSKVKGVSIVGLANIILENGNCIPLTEGCYEFRRRFDDDQYPRVNIERVEAYAST
jgi:hypothetical protein